MLREDPDQAKLESSGNSYHHESLDEPETADDVKERKGSASASKGMNPSGRQVWTPKQQL